MYCNIVKVARWRQKNKFPFWMRSNECFEMSKTIVNLNDQLIFMFVMLKFFGAFFFVQFIKLPPVIGDYSITPFNNIRSPNSTMKHFITDDVDCEFCFPVKCYFSGQFN